MGEEKKTVFGENKIGTIYKFPHPQNADCGHKDPLCPPPQLCGPLHQKTEIQRWNLLGSVNKEGEDFEDGK